MARFGGKWSGLRSMSMVSLNFLLAFMLVSAERGFRRDVIGMNQTVEDYPLSPYVSKAVNFLWQPDQTGYQPVWPVRFWTLYSCSIFLCCYCQNLGSLVLLCFIDYDGEKVEKIYFFSE